MSMIGDQMEDYTEDDRMNESQELTSSFGYMRQQVGYEYRKQRNRLRKSHRNRHGIHRYGTYWLYIYESPNPMSSFK
ncbi:hypothetical protein L596_002022 [Steinernema carpocapsae]|uniref:Uncharacterized protein n=1 Tax=Steinernema carpocapsae TaxID=34508 RepID=A0A4U8UQ08_STECR|nr:hypothetical protein L596_002022 [Steinernema carpocapsae]